MKTNDILDRILDYLKSEEWRTSISLFVDANCHRFLRNEDESYNHEHYSLWKVRFTLSVKLLYKVSVTIFINRHNASLSTSLTVRVGP